jgi:hypothetical protein
LYTLYLIVLILYNKYSKPLISVPGTQGHCPGNINCGSVARGVGNLTCIRLHLSALVR